MLLFIFGGLGGVINASYAMDTIVHNTMWIVGHFHVTVGGPVALSFLGVAYWLIPRLTGRKLWAPSLALAQTYAWFIGMMIMSTAMHWAGILGSPRRTDEVSYFGSTTAAAWMPEMHWAAIGGSILFLSILMFVAVAVGTLFTPKTGDRSHRFRKGRTEDARNFSAARSNWRLGRGCRRVRVPCLCRPGPRPHRRPSLRCARHENVVNLHQAATFSVLHIQFTPSGPPNGIVH